MELTALEQKTQEYQEATKVLFSRRMALYAAIRKSHREGQSYRSIAAETGLTFPRIQQIVKGR